MKDLTLTADSVLENMYRLQRLLDIYHVREAKKLVESIIEQIEGAEQLTAPDYPSFLYAPLLLGMWNSPSGAVSLNRGCVVVMHNIPHHIMKRYKA